MTNKTKQNKIKYPICGSTRGCHMNIDGILQILDLHFLWWTLVVNAKKTKCSYSESCFCPRFKDFAPLLHSFKDFFILFFSGGMKVIICFWVTSQLRRFVGLLGHPRNVKWGVVMVSSAASQHSEEARLMMSKTLSRPSNCIKPEKQPSCKLSSQLVFLRKCGNMLPRSLHRSTTASWAAKCMFFCSTFPSRVLLLFVFCMSD